MENARIRQITKSETGNLREIQITLGERRTEKERLEQFFVPNVSDIYIIFPIQ